MFLSLFFRERIAYTTLKWLNFTRSCEELASIYSKAMESIQSFGEIYHNEWDHTITVRKQGKIYIRNFTHVIFHFLKYLISYYYNQFFWPLAVGSIWSGYSVHSQSCVLHSLHRSRTAHTDNKTIWTSLWNAQKIFAGYTVWCYTWPSMEYNHRVK